MLDKIVDDTILIVPAGNKLEVVENVRRKGLVNVKFYTISEFFKNYYFSYDKRAIYYLMDRYNYDYDVSCKYLDNLMYITNTESNFPKFNKLLKLKNELIEKDLLFKNPLFISSIQGRKVIFYNCGVLSKWQINTIKKLKKITDISLVNENCKKYPHDIYEFATLEDEISGVCSLIREAISSKIDINNIKICGINSEYYSIVKRMFNFYKIPITINESTLYGTKMGQYFLENLNSDVSITLEHLKEKYSCTCCEEIEIYDKIVKIVNEYAWCEEILKCKGLLCEDFKKEIIHNKKYNNEVKVINDLSLAKDVDYVILLNFNQGSIPNIYKDEDYFSDDQKEKMGIDTSYELNISNRKKWINDINSCKNLVITYKKSSPTTSECYISSLQDELQFPIKKLESRYTYSDIFNKINLTRDIDSYIKYGMESERLLTLYPKYSNINYLEYDNKYQGISKDKLKKYLNNNLVLSYSAIDNYFKCGFRYYLNNILKVNIYDKTFYTVLGNLFHYILSICFKNDIDIKKEYYKFIAKEEQEGYIFNAKEKFFLDNLLEELIFIINTIKEQNEYSSLKKGLYEEKK